MIAPKTFGLRASSVALAVAMALTILQHSGGAQVLGPPAATPPPGAVTTLPPPGIELEKALAPLGLTPRGPVYAKKKHQEVMAATKDGRPVVVEFDWAGRVKAVTDRNHQKSATTLPPAPTLLATVRRAGFEPLGVVETKRHHAVVRARNSQGEMLDVHLDFAGTIYKQVWLR
jgi:hypothetical protein